MSHKILMEPVTTPLSAELTDHLMRDLRATNEQAENSKFIFTARDDANQMIGGIIAETSYGWMLIKELWIDENERRNGLGSELVERATHRASELGCHGIWLDTSSPQAHAFYISLEFEVFGTLENAPHQHPKNHQRWLMRKLISG
jgi:predicted N-acetyltransferase YhbS